LKNAWPDKTFFHFFQIILNGQTGAFVTPHPAFCGFIGFANPCLAKNSNIFRGRLADFQGRFWRSTINERESA
jgi:hypothetical protein